MELKEIQFSCYKSVQEWQTIKLNSPIIALTGKNGSGKTNVLDALYFTLSQRADYPFTEPNGFKYKLLLELNQQEFKKFCNEIEISDVNRIIEVGNESNEDSLRPKYIKSKCIVNEIEKKYSDIKVVSEELISNLNEYIKQLQEFTTDSINNDIELGTVDLSMFTDYQFWTGTNFESQLKTILSEAETLNNALIKNDDILNIISQRAPIMTGVCNQLKKIKINTRSLKLSSFQKKVIHLDEATIKSEIEKINKKLSELGNKISLGAEHLENYCKEIDFLNYEYSEKEEEESSQIKSLRKCIDKSIGQKVYYLQNFTSAMFFCPKHEGYSNRNATSYILSAFKKLCNIAESENQVLNQSQLNKFNDILNQSIPSFETQMIDSIEAEQINNEIQIYFKEKSGVRVNLHDANMGRRWYFTFFFYKSCLEKGDIFLIDEPAAFLHPDAQNEIFRDLKKLADKGIRIIYSTHSPYMIPQDIRSLRILTINEKGTHIKELKDEENHLEELKEQIGIISINDLLLRFGKPIVFVEGDLDKACLEKFMDVFEIKTEIEIYPCYGSPVVRTAWIAMKLGLYDFKVLLDNDNKTKPKNSSGNKNFESELKDLEDENKVVYISKDESKNEIEDLFEGNDRKIYLHIVTFKGKEKPKVNFEALTENNNFTNETMQNFKQLLTALGIYKEAKSSS